MALHTLGLHVFLLSLVIQHQVFCDSLQWGSSPHQHQTTSYLSKSNENVDLPESKTQGNVMEDVPPPGEQKDTLNNGLGQNLCSGDSVSCGISRRSANRDYWFNSAERRFTNASENDLVLKGLKEFCTHPTVLQDQCSLCHSDDDCLSFGDCCPPKQDPSKPSPAPTTAMTCSKLRGFPYGYFMIAHCDITSSDPELQGRCKKPIEGSLEDENPVMDNKTGVIYRNFFCALCNGVVNFTPWTVEVDCSKDPSPLYEATSAAALYERASRTEGCKIKYTPLGSARNCTPSPLSVVSNCSRLRYWMKREPRVVRACASYTAITFNSYKNVFCYMCSQRKTWSEILDELEYVEGIRSLFSIPLTAVLTLRPDTARYQATLKEDDHSAASVGGFTRSGHRVAALPAAGGDQRQDSSNHTDQCPAGQTWDPHQCQCRPLLCCPGKSLQRRVCRSPFKTTAFSYQLCLKVHFSANLTRTAMQEELVTRVWNYLLTRANSADTAVAEMELACLTRTRSGDDSLQVTMTVSIRVLPTGLQKPDEVQAATLSRLGQLHLDGWVNSGRVAFLDSSQCHSIDCGEHWKKPCASLDPSPFCVRELHYLLVKIDEKSMELDLKPLLLCSQIELRLDEVIYEENVDAIIILASNCSVNSSYFSVSNDSVKVCFQEYIRCDVLECPSDIVVKDSDHPDTPQSLGILSLVCSTISLVFLAACLTLYYLHKELRTIVGSQRITMIMAFALALGLFEFGAEQTDNKVGCIIIGALCHFFWLVATFQMNVCTSLFFYQVSFPFAARVRLQSVKKVCLWASLYSLGGSALVVGSTVGFSWLHHGDSGYGGPICYLKPSRATVRQLALGLPIGLLVLLNITLFVAALVIVKTRPKLSTTSENKIGLFSCVRLSLITGIVWLLAFLSEAMPNLVLQFVFTLTFGLYGVFIFLDMVILLKSRGLLPRLLPCKKPTQKQRLILLTMSQEESGVASGEKLHEDSPSFSAVGT